MTAAAERRTCVRCVMDTSDRDITFDAEGACNHCHQYEQRRATHAATRSSEPIEQLVERIRGRGAGRDYDCVVGVSGGVDSSYLAWLTKSWGLRPLAVHFDNGWDSELAVQNIRQILEGLGIDLYTSVVDWEEFRDIQISFFEASVIDIELPTDNAIAALPFRVALDKHIPMVLRGNNDTTEAIMPRSWNHNKTDLRNLRAIHRAYGSHKFKTLPTASTLELQWWQRVRRIQAINILDRIEYDRTAALDTLTSQVGWRPYPSKHHESVFTRFYQTYILPTKFGVDKRRAHLSALVNAGAMTRAAALTELEQPPAPVDEVERDRTYVIKKLGIDDARFARWMAAPPRSHDEFPTEDWYVRPLVRAKQRLARRAATSP